MGHARVVSGFSKKYMYGDHHVTRLIQESHHVTHRWVSLYTHMLTI